VVEFLRSCCCSSLLGIYFSLSSVAIAGFVLLGLRQRSWSQSSVWFQASQPLLLFLVRVAGGVFFFATRLIFVRQPARDGILHPIWNRCTYLAWFRSRCPRSSACEHEAPRDFREPICVSIVGVDRFFFRCRWVPLPISSISVLPAPRSQGAVPGLWFVCVVPRCRVCLFWSGVSQCLSYSSILSLVKILVGGSRYHSRVAGSKCSSFSSARCALVMIYQSCLQVFGEICKRQCIALFIWFWLRKPGTCFCSHWLLFPCVSIYLTQFWGPIALR
jgi:hypothetical protein